jgi:hypothetical protein
MFRASRIAAALVGAAVAGGAARADTVAPAAAGAASPPAGDMLAKYVARCALRADQTLERATSEGEQRAHQGELGLAPEWLDGTCDDACQEKVSACLLALTNRTGKHVGVGLLSSAPSLAALRPSASDADFPFQEGTFFGNVFHGQGFACRGDEARKGPQLKRFCALDPGSCNGVMPLADAGSCQERCEMACTRLPDGSERCAAVSCRDPSGRVWSNPITTYLRDRIEAENADELGLARAVDPGLGEIGDGAQAIYRAVDFGDAPGGVRRFVATVASPGAGGRIEVWLDGTRRLGALRVRGTRGSPRDLDTALDARGVTGTHDLWLRFAGLDPRARLISFGLRGPSGRAPRSR